jgi:hypothetical protein
VLHHNGTLGPFCNRWERVALDSGDAHMNGLFTLVPQLGMVNLLECVEASSASRSLSRTNRTRYGRLRYAATRGFWHQSDIVAG